MLSSVIISLLCVFCVCVCEFVVGGFSMGGEFLSLCVWCVLSYSFMCVVGWVFYFLFRWGGTLEARRLGDGGKG